MMSTPAEKKSSESEWAKFYRKFMLFKSILCIACSVLTFEFKCIASVTLEGFTTMVANHGLKKAIANAQVPGLTALHCLQRMWYKLQAKTPSEYTCSIFWAELSRLHM